MKLHAALAASFLASSSLLVACQQAPRSAARSKSLQRSASASHDASMTRPAISSLAPKTTYNVRDFGATGNGKTLDHHAINRAIEAAAAAGGGKVVVPPGTYLCGSIHLKSNIELNIEAGAVILGAPQTPENNPYDPVEEWHGTAYQDGGHTYFHNSLIWGENLENVSITGHGLINGGGLINQDGTEDRLDGFAAGAGTLNQRPPAATGLAARGGGRPFPGGRPPYFNAPNPGNKAIALKLCKGVTLRDITIFHGGHFAILTTGVDLLTIDNVTIDTNRDGMDIDCCRNVMVSNCRINSPQDDGLCPKSTFALGENRITENMVITNCEVSGFQEGTLLDGTMKPYIRNGVHAGTGRIKMGTESNGGFRNITISNCTFRSCRGLALEEVDGGILENVAISNITMMDVYGYPIYITTGQRNRGPDVKGPSILRNVTISHVVATGVESTSGIQITGLPQQPIENLRLEDIRIHFNGGGTKEQAERVPPELDKGYPEPSRVGVMPAYGVFARHVKDLELANFRLTFEQPDYRPIIAAADVHGLEIDNLKAQLSQGISAARFEGVTGLVVRNSPVLEAQGAINSSDTVRPAESVQSNFNPNAARNGQDAPQK
ncbi:MAG TPA: glycosyl hydrolase family 28-related protein [Phycisphaerae bacterium]|nr:glycosyl hydrolase family 28-related protein [Phycisphaerae bacterium]